MKKRGMLEVSLALNPEGQKTYALCKIDSDADINIIPKS